VSPSIFRTASARSSSNRSTPPGPHFGQPGYETDLLYLAGLIALCVGGAGSFSVDGRLTRFRSSSERMKPASDQAGLQDHPIATLRKETRNDDESI
jgi:hypothetical protein